MVSTAAGAGLGEGVGFALDATSLGAFGFLGDAARFFGAFLAVAFFTAALRVAVFFRVAGFFFMPQA